MRIIRGLLSLGMVACLSGMCMTLDILDRPVLAQGVQSWMPRYSEPEPQVRYRDWYFAPESYDPALDIPQPDPRIRWHEGSSVPANAWGMRFGEYGQQGRPYFNPPPHNSPWTLDRRPVESGTWMPEWHSSRPRDDDLPQQWPRRSEVWRDHPEPDLYGRFPPEGHHERLLGPGRAGADRSEWDAPGSTGYLERPTSGQRRSWLDQPFVWPDFLLPPSAMPGGTQVYPGSMGGWVPGM